MSLPWRSEDPQSSLPRALEGAVSELQALLEPTPAQLASSYQRVRQALAAADGGAPQNRSPGRWRRFAADCRRATWAISGGAALALIAGFALGRLTPPSEGAALTASLSAPPLPTPAPAPTGLERSVELPAPEAQLSAQQEPAPAQTTLPQTTLPQATLPQTTLPQTTLGKPLPRRTRRAEIAAASTPSACQRPDSVQRAECWLRREQPRKALQALCGAVPKQEREQEQVAMLRLVAECKLGRDIRERAQRFFTEWPDSPLALRIRNECPGATSSFTAGTKSARAN